MDFLATIGNERRSKRKNAGGSRGPVNHGMPTQEARSTELDRHIASMGRGGTWGDHLEVAAFASAYGVNVRVHHERDGTALLNGGSEDAEDRPLVQIFYHSSWEHFSSVRKLKVPHVGAFDSSNPSVPSAEAAPSSPPPSSPRNPGRSPTPGSESIGRDDDDADDFEPTNAKKSRPSAPAEGRTVKKPISLKSKGTGAKKGQAAAKPLSSSPLATTTTPPPPCSTPPSTAADTANTTVATGTPATAIDSDVDDSSALDLLVAKPRTSSSSSAPIGRQSRRRSSTVKANAKKSGGSGSGTEWSAGEESRVSKNRGKKGKSMAKPVGPKAAVASAAPSVSQGGKGKAKGRLVKRKELEGKVEEKEEVKKVEDDDEEVKVEKKKAEEGEERKVAVLKGEKGKKKKKKEEE